MEPDHSTNGMAETALARSDDADPTDSEPTSRQADAELVATGFRAVYQQHFRFVWRVLARLGVDQSVLDDAAQDVFVVVHRRLPEFEGRSKLSTWIYAIATRVATDHLRRARRQDRLVPLDAELCESRRPDPFEAATRAEDARTLEQVLATIDLDQRTVLVLAELEGCTAGEIAEILGIGVNTVYSRLHRGRAAFEKAVARHRARLERGKR